MAVLGDRAVAGLLSALAEAPDYPGAASFLLTQLVDLTGSARACLLRLDSAQENLTLVAASGFHAIGRGDNGVVRLALTDPELRSGEPTLRDLSETLTAIYGTDFGVHTPWAYYVG